MSHHTFDSIDFDQLGQLAATNGTSAALSKLNPNTTTFNTFGKTNMFNVDQLTHLQFNVRNGPAVGGQRAVKKNRDNNNNNNNNNNNSNNNNNNNNDNKHFDFNQYHSTTSDPIEIDPHTIINSLSDGKYKGDYESLINHGDWVDVLDLAQISKNEKSQITNSFFFSNPTKSLSHQLFCQDFSHQSLTGAPLQYVQSHIGIDAGLHDDIIYDSSMRPQQSFSPSPHSINTSILTHSLTPNHSIHTLPIHPSRHTPNTHQFDKISTQKPHLPIPLSSQLLHIDTSHISTNDNLNIMSLLNPSISSKNIYDTYLNDIKTSSNLLTDSYTIAKNKLRGNKYYLTGQSPKLELEQLLRNKKTNFLPQLISSHLSQTHFVKSLLVQTPNYRYIQNLLHRLALQQVQKHRLLTSVNPNLSASGLLQRISPADIYNLLLSSIDQNNPNHSLQDQLLKLQLVDMSSLQVNQSLARPLTSGYLNEARFTDLSLLFTPPPTSSSAISSLSSIKDKTSTQNELDEASKLLIGNANAVYSHANAIHHRILAQLQAQSVTSSDLSQLSLDNIHTSPQQPDFEPPKHALFSANLIGSQYFPNLPLPKLLTWHKPILNLSENNMNPIINDQVFALGTNPSRGTYVDISLSESEIFKKKLKNFEHDATLSKSESRTIRWKSTATLSVHGSVTNQTTTGSLKNVPSTQFTGMVGGNSSSISYHNGNTPAIGMNKQSNSNINNISLNSSRSSHGINFDYSNSANNQAPPLASKTPSLHHHHNNASLGSAVNDIGLNYQAFVPLLPKPSNELDFDETPAEREAKLYNTPELVRKCLLETARSTSYDPSPQHRPKRGVSILPYYPNSTFFGKTPVIMSPDPDPEAGLRSANRNTQDKMNTRRKDHRDITNAYGGIVLFEHITPEPIIFSNLGMQSNITTLYRKAPHEQHISEIEIQKRAHALSLGKVVVLGNKQISRFPFLSIPEGEFVTILENDLFVTILSTTRMPRMYYDYLLVYTPILPEMMSSDSTGARSRNFEAQNRKKKQKRMKQRRQKREEQILKRQERLASGEDGFDDEDDIDDDGDDDEDDDDDGDDDDNDDDIHSNNHSHNDNDDDGDNGDDNGDGEDSYRNSGDPTRNIDDRTRLETLEKDLISVQHNQVEYHWVLRAIPRIYTVGQIIPLCRIPDPTQLAAPLSRWTRSVIYRHLSTVQSVTPVGTITAEQQKIVVSHSQVDSNGYLISKKIPQISLTTQQQRETEYLFITPEQFSTWFGHQIEYEYWLEQACEQDAQLMSCLLPMVNLWDIGRFVMSEFKSTKHRPATDPPCFGPDGPNRSTWLRDGTTMAQFEGHTHVTVPSNEQAAGLTPKDLESLCLPEEVCIITASFYGLAKLHKKGIVRHIRHDTPQINTHNNFVPYHTILLKERLLNEWWLREQKRLKESRIKQNSEHYQLTRLLAQRQAIDSTGHFELPPEYSWLASPNITIEFLNQIHEDALVKLDTEEKALISSQRVLDYLQVRQAPFETLNATANSLSFRDKVRELGRVVTLIFNHTDQSVYQNNFIPLNTDLLDVSTQLFGAVDSSRSNPHNTIFRQPVLSPQFISQKLFTSSPHILRCMLYVLRQLRRTPWSISEAILHHLETGKDKILETNLYEYGFVGLLPMLKQHHTNNNEISTALLNAIVRPMPPIDNSYQYPITKYKLGSYQTTMKVFEDLPYYYEEVVQDDQHFLESNDLSDQNQDPLYKPKTHIVPTSIEYIPSNIGTINDLNLIQNRIGLSRELCGKGMISYSSSAHSAFISNITPPLPFPNEHTFIIQNEPTDEGIVLRADQDLEVVDRYEIYSEQNLIKKLSQNFPLYNGDSVFDVEAVSYLPLVKVSTIIPPSLGFSTIQPHALCDIIQEEHTISEVSERVILSLHKGPLFNFKSLSANAASILLPPNRTKTTSPLVEESHDSVSKQQALESKLSLRNANTLSYSFQLLVPNLHEDVILQSTLAKYKHNPLSVVLSYNTLPDPVSVTIQDYFSPLGFTTGSYPNGPAVITKLEDCKDILRRTTKKYNFVYGVFDESVQLITDSCANKRYDQTDIVPVYERDCALYSQSGFKLLPHFGDFFPSIGTQQTNATAITTAQGTITTKETGTDIKPLVFLSKPKPTNPNILTAREAFYVNSRRQMASQYTYTTTTFLQWGSFSRIFTRQLYYKQTNFLRSHSHQFMMQWTSFLKTLDIVDPFVSHSTPMVLQVNVLDTARPGVVAAAGGVKKGKSVKQATIPVAKASGHNTLSGIDFDPVTQSDIAPLLSLGTKASNSKKNVLKKIFTCIKCSPRILNAIIHQAYEATIHNNTYRSHSDKSVQDIIYPFLHEVIGVPGYKEKVSEPMWVNKMLDRLKMSYYPSIDEFINDLQRMVVACEQFNTGTQTASLIQDAIMIRDLLTTALIGTKSLPHDLMAAYKPKNTLVSSHSSITIALGIRNNPDGYDPFVVQSANAFLDGVSHNYVGKLLLEIDPYLYRSRLEFIITSTIRLVVKSYISNPKQEPERASIVQIFLDRVLAPEYTKIVKKPICLNDILLKQYLSFTRFLEDLDLLVSNFKLYNGQNHQFLPLATQCRSELIAKVTEILQHYSSSSPPTAPRDIPAPGPQPPPYALHIYNIKASLPTPVPDVFTLRDDDELIEMSGKGKRTMQATKVLHQETAQFLLDLFVEDYKSHGQNAILIPPGEAPPSATPGVSGVTTPARFNGDDLVELGNTDFEFGGTGGGGGGGGGTTFHPAGGDSSRLLSGESTPHLPQAGATTVKRGRPRKNAGGTTGNVGTGASTPNTALGGTTGGYDMYGGTPGRGGETGMSDGGSTPGPMDGSSKKNKRSKTNKGFSSSYAGEDGEEGESDFSVE